MIDMMTRDSEEETLEPIPLNEHKASSEMQHLFSFGSILENQDQVLQPGRSDSGSVYSDTINSGSETDGNSKWDEDYYEHVTNVWIMKTEVRGSDVLLGRGKSNQKHPGNKTYQGKGLQD
jgi:hypothetical protein